jgi:hypothetical protein
MLKNSFQVTLKVSVHRMNFKVVGRRFQAFGAATTNALSPKFRVVQGIM